MLAFVLFLSGLAAGWWAYANWSKGVVVYERGFAVQDRKGNQFWRWEDIVSLTAAVTRPFSSEFSIGMTHVYCLINTQNQRMVLSDVYFIVKELAIIIQDAFSPILFDWAAQQYNAGQMLVFGPVTIGKRGIQIGKKKFGWAKVRQDSIQWGILKASQKEGDWLSGAKDPASVIPNLNVLLHIVHQVVGLKTG